MYWFMGKILQGLAALVFVGVGLAYTYGGIALLKNDLGRQLGPISMPYNYNGENKEWVVVALIAFGWVMAAILAGAIAFIGLGIQYFVGGIRVQRRM